MKMAAKSAIVAVLAALSAQWSIADWNRVGGPEGGVVTALTAVGDTVIAGTIGGIYRSFDGAAHWSSVDQGISKPFYFEERYITAVAICGKYYIAGSARGEIFRSADDGAHWTKVDSGLTELYTFATNGPNIFAIKWHNVIRSTDTGAHWAVINCGFTNQTTAMTDMTKIGSTIFVGTDKSIFRSVDNGDSWVPSNPNSTNPSVWYLSANESTVFATNRTSIFRSIDNGVNWMKCHSCLPNQYVRKLTANGSIIFARLDSGGVIRSTDNGVSWSTINADISNAHPYFFTGSGGAALYAGTDGCGVFRSNDSGVHWIAVNSGMQAHRIGPVAAAGSNLFAGTSSGIFRSVDNGVSWTQANSGLAAKVYCLLSKGTDLFAGTGDGVFLSTDYATSWIAANHGMECPDKQPPYITSWAHSLAAIGTNIIACEISNGSDDSCRIFFSSNNGQSWTPITFNFLFGRYPSRIDFLDFAVTGSKLYVATTYYNQWNFGSNIRVLTDSGKKWTTQSDNGFPAQISSFVSKDGTIFCGATSAGNVFPPPTHYDGIIASTDDGATWKFVNSGLPDSSKITVSAFAVNDTAIFAAIYPGNVFFSTDNGRLWQPLDSGFPPHTYINKLTVYGNYVYAATNVSDFWRCLLPGTAVKKTFKPPADRLSFSIIAATRMSPALTITFFLSTVERVAIKIYDFSGHEVAALADKVFDAGTHNVPWDTRSVAAGYYVIKMRMKSQTFFRNIPVVR